MQHHLIYPKVARWVLLFLLLPACQLHFYVSVSMADDNGPVTPPEIRMPTGVRIESQSSEPESKNEKSWFSRNKWWVTLGVVVLGGSVAATTGGSSSGGGSDSDDENGIYELEW